MTHWQWSNEAVNLIIVLRIDKARGYMLGNSIWDKLLQMMCGDVNFVFLNKCMFTLFYDSNAICQIVGVSEVCDHNGERVSKDDKSFNICSIGLKKPVSSIWKMWDSVYFWLVQKIF